MAFRHQGGGDPTHGGRVNAPGWFHVVVEKITDQVLKRDGSPVQNAAFKCVYRVLAGTAPSQVDLPHEETFYFPKNSGEQFKEADHFFIATGAMTPQQVKDRVDVEINLDALENRQLIVQLVADRSEKAAGKDWVKAWSNYYHVDDPSVKNQPKNEAALKMIPPTLRLIGKPPEYFTCKESPKQAAVATSYREL
jgi:hypothetical protein